jgi:hypothetical protein
LGRISHTASAVHGLEMFEKIDVKLTEPYDRAIGGALIL